MGEVDAARDTRLERSVAIKVLPREFSDDAGRRARFEREGAGAVFTPTSPVALMETRFTEWEASGGVSYAVAPDGSRVLVSTSTDTGRPVSLMQNWPARGR